MVIGRTLEICCENSLIENPKNWFPLSPDIRLSGLCLAVMWNQRKWYSHR